MKKIALILAVVSTTAFASPAKEVTASLTKMYCTGYADGVHTAVFGKGPSASLLAQYSLECEKDPKAFSAFMETYAIAKGRR